MRDTKHTPGPWEADGYEVRQSGALGTRMVADVCYTGPHHTPDEEYPKSCRIADESNALLIAAAPEMLEMLEEILADGGFRHLGMVDLCRAVIAKAKGVQS